METARKNFTWLTFLIFPLCISPSSIRANPYNISPILDQKIREALEENYNLNFEKALEILASLKESQNDHPVISFGETLTHWWKLTTQVLEEDRKASRPFLASANNTLRIANKKIKKRDEAGEAHLVKGATLGLLGRWHIKNRHWVKSYFTGRKAKRYLKKALKINPDLKDAYTGMGAYDYFVAKLPGMVRFLAFLGHPGDPSIGLDEMRKSVEEGLYTKIGSKIALTFIYIRNEKDPEKALALANDLVSLYPRNSFIRALKAISLYDSGQIAELIQESQYQLKLLQEKKNPFRIQRPGLFLSRCLPIQNQELGRSSKPLSTIVRRRKTNRSLSNVESSSLGIC